MRRTLTTTTATALLAILALTGCSSSGPTDKQKQYADAVAAADPDDFGSIPTNDLASTLGSEGTDICDQLKISFADAAAYAKLARSQKEASALIVGAVLIYCPDLKGKVPAS
jgi:PBP1b-binding outer membrane lipoprotein LpoB